MRTIRIAEPRSLGTLLAAALALTLVAARRRPLHHTGPGGHQPARHRGPAEGDPERGRPHPVRAGPEKTPATPSTSPPPNSPSPPSAPEKPCSAPRAATPGACASAPTDSGSTPPRSPTGRGGTASSPSPPTPPSTAPRVAARLTPEADRYQLDWDVEGGSPDQLGLAYDLSSAGHWYGHGEAETPQGGPGVDQPWPLDAGEVDHETFGPASYNMIDPFWYTSTSTGLRVDTGHVMDVTIDEAQDGLGPFTVESPDTYKATVFVESTPLEVYRDYIGIVGKPPKSDATYEQYAKPLWNSWAQFYTKVDQEKLLDYATDLHDNGLDGHTIQLDDKWESNYGNLTWDPKTFPDPKGISKKIHDMGFDFGIWVTLWINLDSDNYQYAVDNGYLLMDAEDTNQAVRSDLVERQSRDHRPGQPRRQGLVRGQPQKLMDAYDIDGLKFDTRFFDEKCAPARPPGHGLPEARHRARRRVRPPGRRHPGALEPDGPRGRLRHPPGRQGHRLGLPARLRHPEPGHLHHRLPVRRVRHDRRLRRPARTDEGRPGAVGAVRLADAADVRLDLPRGHQRHHHRAEGGLRPGDGRPLPARRSRPTRSSPPTSGTRCGAP